MPKYNAICLWKMEVRYLQYEIQINSLQMWNCKFIISYIIPCTPCKACYKIRCTCSLYNVHSKCDNVRSEHDSALSVSRRYVTNRSLTLPQWEEMDADPTRPLSPTNLHNVPNMISCHSMAYNTSNLINSSSQRSVQRSTRNHKICTKL